MAGEHARKGYTAFVIDITRLLRWGSSNTIVVRVDSAFNGNMLPRGRSSDWAHDGGIYRPVQLFITAKTFVERVDLEAVPDLASGDGGLPSPLISEIQIRSRGRDEPFFELSTMRPD